MSERAFAFTLNQQVRVPLNGKTGKVIGQWRSVGGEDQFHVEFADDIGGINRVWFIASDIEA